MSAAYSTGSALGPNATDNFYQAVRTAMLANGWTLHDTISDAVGSRVQIFKSSPIDATADNCCYVKLSATGSTWAQQTYTDWDTTTNVGAKEGGSSGAATFSSTTFTYFLRVNEFAIAFAAKVGSTYYKSYVGFVRRGLPSTKNGLTKTTAPYAAGVSSVSVASDMTTRLKVGQKVVIYNHGHDSTSPSFSNAEMLTIQSILAGSITFTTPTNFSYDTGAVIGWNPFPAICNELVSAESLGTTARLSMNHDGSWISNTGQTASIDPVILAAETSADPDDLSLEYQSGVIAATVTTTAKTGFHGYLYHWEACAMGSQAKEDIMDDGVSTYIVLMTVGTTAAGILGPM